MVKLGSQFDKVYHAEPMSGSGRFMEADRIHVGTERAALARVHPDNWEGFDDHPPSYEYAAGRSRLWEGTLRSGVSVGPHVTDDMANRVADNDRSSPHVSAYRGHDVLPYTNEYEDPGSRSLVVKPGAVTRWRPVASGPAQISQRIERA